MPALPKIKNYVNRQGHNLSIIALVISLGTVAYVATTDQGETRTDVPEIALCQVEDGSSQGVCWWHDDANGWFLNLDHGKGVYVPRTGDLITF